MKRGEPQTPMYQGGLGRPLPKSKGGTEGKMEGQREKNQLYLTFTENSPCAMCSKCSICLNSFALHNNPPDRQINAKKVVKTISKKNRKVGLAPPEAKTF